MVKQSLLRFPESVSLGLHAMAYLARYPEQRFTAQQMAEVLSGSTHHLAKVLQRLARAGVIHSLKGPQGGFSLRKAADQITLAEICEIIEGPLGEAECLLAAPICDGRDCVLGEMIQSMQSQLAEFLTSTTLFEVANSLRVVNIR